MEIKKINWAVADVIEIENIKILRIFPEDDITIGIPWNIGISLISAHYIIYMNKARLLT
jgi:hypothetical protein